MTTDTTAVSPAFAACEALFAASPAAITDEGGSGRVMPVIIAGRRNRLVQHDTCTGRFYRVYPVHEDLAILTIVPDGEVPAEITAQLAAAVPG